MIDLRCRLHIDAIEGEIGMKNIWKTNYNYLISILKLTRIHVVYPRNLFLFHVFVWKEWWKEKENFLFTLIVTHALFNFRMSAQSKNNYQCSNKLFNTLWINCHETKIQMTITLYCQSKCYCIYVNWQRFS